jgi:hypothetical protein
MSRPRLLSFPVYYSDGCVTMSLATDLRDHGRSSYCIRGHRGAMITVDRANRSSRLHVLVIVSGQYPSPPPLYTPFSRCAQALQQYSNAARPGLNVEQAHRDIHVADDRFRLRNMEYLQFLCSFHP